MNFPKLSVVICTYNNKELVKRCLDSIFSQDYKNLEVITVDGGSTDGTLNLLKKYNVILINNKKRFPEGKGMGKDQGYKKASGKFILFIDQDNKLVKKNTITNLVKPLINNNNIFGSACPLFIDKDDSLTNRYLSYVGTDPFAIFRSLEGKLALNNIKLEDKKDYFTYTFTLMDNLCTGGNVFLYRKSALDKIDGYTQDVDVIRDLVKNGFNKLAIPKNTFTHHITTIGFLDFLKKRWKWGVHYQTKNKQNRDYSWSPTNTKDLEFHKNVIKNLILIPNTLISIKKYLESKDSAWLLHPIASFLITLEYILIYLLYR
jgi:glycosyltransferase involved in cell wall biosynthesis